MLVRILGVCLLLFSSSALGAGKENVDKVGLAIQGYDPVAYFNSGKATRGSADFKVQLGERIYWFVSEKNKTEFLKDPKKFEPQFGGWCAYAVADSKQKVEIDPQSFLIQDGRLLLFYNGFWGDTRKKWLQTKGKDAKHFLQQADRNWPEVENKEP